MNLESCAMLRYLSIFAAGLCLTTGAAFAQTAPSSEAQALRRELAELQEALKQTRQALAEAKEDLAALEQQKLTTGGSDQLDEWRDERQRLAREQRMLLHERQRLDVTRESLHRTMRAEARRMENEPLVAPDRGQPQHAAPGTVVGSVPSRSYIYQYGPLGPSTSYGGGYYVPPAFGHYGFGFRYPSYIYDFGHHDHHHGHHHRHRGHDHGFFFGGGGVGATRDYFPSSGTFSPWRPANPSSSDVYRPANPGAGFWGGGGAPGSAIPGAKR